MESTTTNEKAPNEKAPNEKAPKEKAPKEKAPKVKTKKMKIVLDERETPLFEKCKSIPSNEDITKQVLPLGDVLITRDDQPFLILERKTLNDLLASIKDGRYEEQSYRLIHSSQLPPHNIVYIIEGILSQISPMDKKIVYSAITSLNVFKGFSVIRTSSIQETAELVIAMTNKVERDLDRGKQPWTMAPTNSEDPSSLGAGESYCSVVKKVKKENITQQNIGEIMLCQIPSVSSVYAVSIMQKYETLAKLIHALEENPKALDGITYMCKDKPRKISSLAIQNIVHYLSCA